MLSKVDCCSEKLGRCAMDKPFNIWQLIIIGLVTSAIVTPISKIAKQMWQDWLKAKMIAKVGYPPPHCDALGESYEEDEDELKELRDKFAAHAMSALIRFNHAPEQNGTERMDIPDTAFWAYRYADEMLKHRKTDVKEVSNG